MALSTSSVVNSFFSSCFPSIACCLFRILPILSSMSPEISTFFKRSTPASVSAFLISAPEVSSFSPVSVPEVSFFPAVFSERFACSPPLIEAACIPPLLRFNAIRLSTTRASERPNHGMGRIIERIIDTPAMAATAFQFVMRLARRYAISPTGSIKATATVKTLTGSTIQSTPEITTPADSMITRPFQLKSLSLSINPCLFSSGFLSSFSDTATSSDTSAPLTGPISCSSVYIAVSTAISSSKDPISSIGPRSLRTLAKPFIYSTAAVTYGSFFRRSALSYFFRNFECSFKSSRARSLILPDSSLERSETSRPFKIFSALSQTLDILHTLLSLAFM